MKTAQHTKNTNTHNKLPTAAATLLMSVMTIGAMPIQADEFGTAKVDLRLRYEAVDQDNALQDADALTLRTRLNYTTKSFSGFSAVVEFEDSRTVLGINDYNDTNGNNTGYSVIADPETTELDQAFLQYKQDGFTAKVGRQVIALDGHRFVGHVGFRQDRQTFDAVTLAYQFNKDMKAQYSYINKRNRIFADEKDIDAKDHLLNVSYATDIGKVTAYGYLLEVDNDSNNSIDTWGISLTGKTDLSGTKVLYAAEIATQSAEAGMSDFDALYSKLEVGAVMSGITAKVGYESLGSDDGAYGFATPLATLHKFNGWSDQFLGTPSVGLDDVYVSLAGKAMGGKWLLAYHDFSADDASASVDDLGTELNVSYSRKFQKHYNAGIKYAAYSAGDSDAGKVDTDKVWLWVGASF